MKIKIWQNIRYAVSLFIVCHQLTHECPIEKAHLINSEAQIYNLLQTKQFFVTYVNGKKPLPNVTRIFIIDAARALETSLKPVTKTNLKMYGSYNCKIKSTTTKNLVNLSFGGGAGNKFSKVRVFIRGHISQGPIFRWKFSVGQYSRVHFSGHPPTSTLSFLNFL